MTGEGPDEPGRARGRDPRRPHRSSRPLWLGGLPQPEGPAGPGRAGAWPRPDDPGAYGSDLGDASMCCEACDRPHDPATCRHCAAARGAGAAVDGSPGPDGLGDLVCDGCADPDLGDIVVILLVSTLAGLRDRLERDGFASAAGLVHDLVEVADDYATRFQP